MPELHPALAGLSWLVGTWHGLGVGGYPTIEPFRYAEELTIRHDGRPFLSYESRTWLIDDDGARIRPAHGEVGFWRPVPAAPPGEPNVELVLAHPTGIVEIYLGLAGGARVELASDLVARTATAREVGSLKRLYGLVDGPGGVKGGGLAYAIDLAAGGQPLQSHLSAHLSLQSHA